DDAVQFLRRLGRSPLLLEHDLGDVPWETGWVVLRRQLIERTIVGQANQVGALDLADDLVAAFFFEDLLERLELGDAVDPFLALELLFEAMGREGALGEVVDLVLVFDFEVSQLGMNRGADVAREGPRGCRPDEEVLASVRLQTVAYASGSEWEAH